MKILMVHPDDVDLADIKSMASDLGVSVTGNAFVPRGQAFVCDAPSLVDQWRP